MLTGLCALSVDNTGKITTLWARDMDADDLDDCMKDQNGFAGFAADPNATLYYFGNDEDADGAMKTGSTTISLDGDSYAFNFSKSGGSENKGRGLTGIDDGKTIYKYGKKIKADSDDKYKVVYAKGDTGSGTAKVFEVDSSVLRKNATSTGVNKDDDTVKYFGTLGTDYYLVNTSGTIVKDKSAAKDGNDWYYYVDGKNVRMYTSSKTLTSDGATNTIVDKNNKTLKDNWDKGVKNIVGDKTVPATLTLDNEYTDK